MYYIINQKITQSRYIPYWTFLILRNGPGIWTLFTGPFLAEQLTVWARDYPSPWPIDVLYLNSMGVVFAVPSVCNTGHAQMGQN